MCFALPGAGNAGRIRVWDFPTRLFHWSLTACVAVAFITGFVGANAMNLHGKAGIAIVGLVAFRVVWGINGSTYARFANFVRGPAAIRAYLRGEWQGLGHNPLGALSVLGLLGLAAFQVATGLFGNDDIAYNGPLYALVRKETSDLLTGLHHRSAWFLLSLVALHLGVIAYYVRVKKDNLVLPMLTGWKERRDKRAECASGGGLVAFIVAAAIGVGAALIASGALLPPPPPPAPESAPGW